MKTFITIAILLSISTKSNAQIVTRRRGSAKPTIVRNRVLRGNPQQQQQRRVEKTSSAKAEKAASAKSAKMYKNTKSAKASSFTDAIQESPTALIAVSRYDENGKLITEYFNSPPEGYQLTLDQNLEAMSTPLQDMMSMSMIGALVEEATEKEEEEGENASSSSIIQAPVAPSASTSVKSSSLCIVGTILTGIFMQL